MSRYMMVLLFSVAIPFLASFWPPLKFYRHYRALLFTIGLIVIVFAGWDIFATWRGHWSFNPEGVGRLKVINLPLEEVLFFVVIPFCSIFTWEAILYLWGKRK